MLDVAIDSLGAGGLTCISCALDEGRHLTRTFLLLLLLLLLVAAPPPAAAAVSTPLSPPSQASPRSTPRRCVPARRT
jgi:hypothetical protein